MQTISPFLLLPSLLFALVSLAVDTTKNPTLISHLRSIPSTQDRMTLLPQDSDWFFDFTQQKPNYNFWPGGVINANAATFPALAGYGMTMALLNLGPCSMLPPHFHRAVNLVTAINGTTHTYMIAENGVRTVKTVLTAGTMTVFPAGSVHMMYNPTCDPVQLVSALNSDDAGTTNIANALSMMDPEYLPAVFGYNSNSRLNASMMAGIPPVGTGAQFGSKQCLARCGFTAS